MKRVSLNNAVRWAIVLLVTAVVAFASGCAHHQYEQFLIHTAPDPYPWVPH
jgi:hypothetical protein